jgi:hypothetical protein
MIFKRVTTGTTKIAGALQCKGRRCKSIQRIPVLALPRHAVPAADAARASGCRRVVALLTGGRPVHCCRGRLSEVVNPQHLSRQRRCSASNWSGIIAAPNGCAGVSEARSGS